MDSLQYWPVLTANWRSILGAMFGFFGAALGTAGGIGGGTIFVPMLNLILEFDPKSSVALSKCMILGASISTVIYNLFRTHPEHDLPLIDYNLGFLLMPMLLLGISIGVKLNVIFPGWVITAGLVIMSLATGSRVFSKAIKAWRDETNKKKHHLEERSGDQNPPLDNEDPSKLLDNLRKNISWTMATMVLVWMVLLVLQIVQIHTPTCSTRYWVLSSLQVPVAVTSFILAAIKVYKCVGKDKTNGKLRLVLGSGVGSTMGGIISGMVGLGGGFVTGPILLEFGVHPQVCSATATFIMLFSSSLAVVEYYFLHRFPLPYASFLFLVALVGGVVGQHIMQRLVKFLGRPSIIVFLLCSLTLLSALLLGGLGIQRTIHSWKVGDYMGLSKLC